MRFAAQRKRLGYPRPQPPRQFYPKPIPRRLPERKPPVTIAAGLVCSDGVVLCADTLLSANYRQQGPKLWAWNGKHGQAVAMTGAGNYVLLKLAREAIFRGLDATKGKAPSHGTDTTP